jgi:hypothetical protein
LRYTQADVSAHALLAVAGTSGVGSQRLAEALDDGGLAQAAEWRM